jgi:hypothetical protein
MLVQDADGKMKSIPVDSAPAHNYVLGVDFQGEDIWVATAKGMSHGIRQHGSTETAQASRKQIATEKK